MKLSCFGVFISDDKKDSFVAKAMKKQKEPTFFNTNVHTLNVEVLSFKSSVDTLLMRSMDTKRNSPFISSLVRRQRKVDLTKYICSLSAAVSYGWLCVAKRLIQRGAQINTRNETGHTPLLYAVRAKNLEAVCMLLYYGADVTIPDRDNRTPLVHALLLRKWNIAEILIDYYADFSCVSAYGETAIDLAVKNGSPLRFVEALIRAGANVSHIGHHWKWQSIPIVHALRDPAMVDTFKLIWSAIDPRVLLDMKMPFLGVVLDDCAFSLADWLECLSLVLSSLWAIDFIEMYNSVNRNSFMIDLLIAFVYREVMSQKDRMAIIYLYLSTGVRITIDDARYIKNLYRHVPYPYSTLGEELKAIIYCGSFRNEDFELKTKCLDPVTARVLGLDIKIDEYDVYRHCKICIGQLREANVFITLAYFSIPTDLQNKLINVYRERFGSEERIREKLKCVPDLPSLTELSRDKFHKYVRDSFDVERPYEFLDVIKNAKIPEGIKDLILFRTPIYLSYRNY